MKIWKEKQLIPCALLTGFLYGTILSAAALAAIQYLGCRISPWYSKHPLDQVAYATIIPVCGIVFFAVMLIDYLKSQGKLFFKRFLIKFGVMVVSALLMLYPVWLVMCFFHDMLSGLVP